MNFIVSQLSQVPIYEQLENQIRQNVLSGKLKTGDALPSIRTLAKELGIGIITVKRAYDDLCGEGILVSLQGRGVFVAELDSRKAKAIRIEKLREQLGEVRRYCEASSISKEELLEEIGRIYGGDEDEK